MATVQLQGIAKTYAGSIPALTAMDLAIDSGAWFVVLGPSGSGKSTLLRLIAGLETPSGGSVWIDGQRVDERPPRRRDVALVFQTPVLYPYLSVFENLAFGLRARRKSRDEVTRLVGEASAILGLDGKLSRRPEALSGGERQRVALGRALVRRPRVLLLDEPFSGLDPPLKRALRDDLANWQRRLGITTIHVTHDQGEALALGTSLAVLNAGRIVQTGSPQALYARPAERFVAGFLGNPPMDLLPCAVEHDGGTVALHINGEPVRAPGNWPGPPVLLDSDRIDLGIRAEHVRLSDGPAPDALVTRGTIVRLEPQGHETLAIVAVGVGAGAGKSTVHVHTRLAPDPEIAEGAPVAVAIDPRRIVWFDPGSGRVID